MKDNLQVITDLLPVLHGSQVGWVSQVITDLLPVLHENGPGGVYAHATITGFARKRTRGGIIGHGYRACYSTTLV